MLAACLGSVLLACSGAPLLAGLAPHSITVSPAQLQQALGQRFPLRQRLAEVLELEVLAPRLSLLPASNRLATDTDVNLGDRLLGGRYSAALGMDFGLRFEPRDNTIRMTGAQVRQLGLTGVPEPYQSALARQLPRLAERWFDDRVLHQFSAQELSLVNGLGLTPGEIRVTPQGLRVSLVPIPVPVPMPMPSSAPAAPAAPGTLAP